MALELVYPVFPYPPPFPNEAKEERRNEMGAESLGVERVYRNEGWLEWNWTG